MASRAFALFLLGLLALPSAGEEDTPTIRIPRVTRPPVLEDFLTGRPREAETVVTDFRQFDPGDGTPVTQPTTAYLSYDAKNLYAIFVCKDDPALIRARKAKRKDILYDDRVTINIDASHDHRHAYFFDANPYGIQLDGVTNEGFGDDFSFETVWHSEGRFTEDGYIVYLRIPFRSMRFSADRSQVWGVILARYINRNNEWSIWPYITRRKLPHWITQFGHMEGLEDISPGRNFQFIPYGLLSGSRFLDNPAWGVPAIRSKLDGRAGLDAKVVLKDAFTLDMALNPDFSQVESDEPQVTVNQRYEVFFPEKRPFFMESAGYFITPQKLFFSRRIADPEFGVRFTGKTGPWAVGLLAADDRAPGAVLAPGDRHAGNRAGIGVMRIRRDIGRDSHLGLLATSRDFGGSSNRVASLDARLRWKNNWSLTGQAIATETRRQNGARQAGPGYFGSLSRFGRHLRYSTSYTDRSPGFFTELGFIPRVDIREIKNIVDYRWRPEGGKIQAWGPSLTVLGNWNRAGAVQDWEVNPSFNLELTKRTEVHLTRSESYELFQGVGFRKGVSTAAFSTEWWKWLEMNGQYQRGAGVNYYPAAGRAPFLASAQTHTLGVTLRPRPDLKLDETYIFDRLGTSSGAGIFNNHILRSKANFQFSREWSLRAIVDYNAVLPNRDLVSLDRTRRFGFDVLLTYLLHPGTAIYAGYSDIYENLFFQPGLNPQLSRTLSPGMSTGRLLFVKMSYLLRF